MCAQIASYYRLSVQQNNNDIPSIILAINAIPLHLGANNGKAATNHRYCPYSQDRWCHYQVANFNNRQFHIILITYLRQLLISSFLLLMILSTTRRSL